MPDSTGPVQLLAVAFGAGTRFEGQIAEELDRLEPGTSAAFMAFEHVWARGLKQAIGDVGGVPCPGAGTPAVEFSRSSPVPRIGAGRRSAVLGRRPECGR
jgi:hypothetical protein